jgi:hypothetical protein
MWSEAILPGKKQVTSIPMVDDQILNPGLLMVSYLFLFFDFAGRYR